MMHCIAWTHSIPFSSLCSSQTETNQFTGMVYQGLLLSERKRLRTESIEEHITPNSAPAQWPGTFFSFIVGDWLFIHLALAMLVLIHIVLFLVSEIEVKLDHFPQSHYE